MGWADKFRTHEGARQRRTPPEDAQAREFGAEGIGLCRTEHMFFGARAHHAVREMILAEDLEADRRKALARSSSPSSGSDFVGIFKAMDGLPVTIRLLDPPLHEFLPHDDAGQGARRAMAVPLGSDIESVKRIARHALHELNPMLGHRGCRLGITYPEIYRDAGARHPRGRRRTCSRNGRSNVLPEIMIPLVGTVTELEMLAADTARCHRADRHSWPLRERGASSSTSCSAP